MKKQKKPISTAIKKLQENLTDIGRVREWAELMGYKDPKKFGEDFLQHHNIRPHKAMDCIRLKSIIEYLKASEYTHHKIARTHSLPNEKALNNYTNYHLGYSPSDLKSMQDSKLESIMEKLDSKIQR